MQQAGPVLFALGGRLIGGYLGGPIGSVIGGMAGGLIGSMIFNRAQKPLIPDIPMMSSSYGNPIPIIYGTVRLPGTVIWMSPVTVHGHGPGKGFGGGTGASQYSYWQDVMVAFCEGPVNLVRVFLDGKLFLDNTTDNGELTKYRFALRTYVGDENQVPDFKYTTWVDLQVGLNGMAPGYRGLSYLMFDKIDLAHFGGRFPQVTAVWSNNANYQTVFRKLNRWVPDISGNTSSVFGSGLAVDWLRQVAYSLSTDGTIRVFDLRSGICINAAILPQVKGIACGNGTKLYGYGTGSGDVIPFYTINPDTLNVNNTAPISHSGSVGSNFPGTFIAISIPAPNGAYDLVAGTWLVGGSGFVCNPANGAFAETPLARSSFFTGGTCCWGNQDLTTGDTDIWFTNWDPDDPAQALYLLRASITASGWNVSVLDLLLSYGFGAYPTINANIEAEFTAATFGVTGGVPRGTPNYDASDDTIIVRGVGFPGIGSFKWTPQTNGIVWTNSYGGGSGGNTVIDIGRNAGQSGWTSDITVIDTGTGITSSSPTAGGVPEPHSIFPNMVYDSYSNSLVFFGSDQEYYVAYLQRVVGPEYPVAGIITDICERVGLQASDLDVSLVTDTVWGYAITDNKSAGAAIADLCHAFQLDMVESDYTLRFVPRGQPSVVTIPQSDLGSVDANDFGKFWEARLAQELEMPLMISVKYQDPDLDYNPGSEYAKRTALPLPTVFTKRRRSLDLPIIATAIEARQIAEKWLYTMWAERNTYDTVLSPEYLWLDPGDNITVTMDDGSIYGTRIESEEIGADLSMKLSVTSEDATVYAGSTSRGALLGIQPQTILQAQFGQILLFNVPLLQDLDDTAGTSMRIYYAAGAFSQGWTSGNMFNSLDGATWSQIATMPTAVDWGYTSSKLGNTPAVFATDYVNTVTVAFSGGTFVPTDCTYEQLMSGANAMLIGSELIQFMTATENTDGSFTLSGLARGRRGTEWASGTHRIGEFAIMLEIGPIATTRKPLPEIGQVEQWRLVPVGRFLDQVPNMSFAYLGYDLMPYAPIYFKRAPSGSDLLLTWIRRTRVGGYLADGVNTVPLAETTEAYEAYVLPSQAALATFDPTDPTSYTRAFTGLTTPQVTYTAAEMATDSFTPATATLYLVVYQLSSVVGRGFRGYQALPAF